MEGSSELPPKPIPHVTFENRYSGTDTDVKYQVKDSTGKDVGEVELLYYPRRKEIEIGWVEVHEGSRNQGYGLAIYSQASRLPSFDGERYRLVSSGQMSDEAVRTWESLVKRGLAVKSESGRFEMIDEKPLQKAA